VKAILIPAKRYGIENLCNLDVDLVLQQIARNGAICSKAESLRFEKAAFRSKIFKMARWAV
jgi:hypothetical protein